jgi:carbonic anhydrase
MKTLKRLFERNRAWAEEISAREPGFFRELSRRQSPEYLWIGCSDSRVPSTQLVNLSPGEMFVHRNVANVVVHTDLNCLSVMQYAVEVLKVRHIIVCGHYGCGGVQAALEGARFGLIDNWLRHVQDVVGKHAGALARVEDGAARLRLLCELNVREQVLNVCRTTVVQDAWERGQELSVHGWVYALEDGLLRDLGLCVTCPEDLTGAEEKVETVS